MTTRQPHFCLRGLLLALCCLAGASRASEVEDAVGQFLETQRELAVAYAEIASSRAAMLENIDDGALLDDTVGAFFDNRIEASQLRRQLAADRKALRTALGFKGRKLAKPAKSSGDLARDAASFIASYDAWTALGGTLNEDLQLLRAAHGAKDSAAMTSAGMRFFTDRRRRLETRLQWQSDLRGLRKITGFRGTGKVNPPTATTLPQAVTTFLELRREWEAQGLTVQADINNVRAALADTSSLESAVRSLLADRRARRIKGRELELARKLLRDLAGVDSKESPALKAGAEPTAKDEDNEDESSVLEESSDEAGEK